MSFLQASFDQKQDCIAVMLAALAHLFGPGSSDPSEKRSRQEDGRGKIWTLKALLPFLRNISILRKVGYAHDAPRGR